MPGMRIVLHDTRRAEAAPPQARQSFGVPDDQRQTHQPRDLRDTRPRSADRLFHRDRRPGAGGAGERARLPRDQARRPRGSTREGRPGALRPHCVPGRPQHRVRRDAARHRGRRPALPDAQRPQARDSQESGFRRSQGDVVRGVRRADADRRQARGCRHRTDQARPSRLRCSGAEGLCRLLQPCARLSGIGLDPGLVRVHALRPGSSHRELRAGQAHPDAPHRLRAQGLGADPASLRLPRRQEHSDHLGPGPARARPQRLYLSPQSRRPDHRDVHRARQDARRVARLLRSAALAPRPAAGAEGVDLSDRHLGPAAHEGVHPPAGVTGRDMMRDGLIARAGATMAAVWETIEMNRPMLGALVVLAALTGAAAAQDYPNRPIKFMHGFPPGGNVDIIARLVGNEMSKGLGQSIIIEAKPGVAGSLAAEAVARSDPDGYTLLVLPSAHPAHGALSRNVPYKVVDDFEWISVASFYPFLICVRADSRFRTLGQLIEAARKDPGALKYGSAGVGSILHTTVELMANETKTRFLHIPYRGEAPALTGLLQGDIDFIAATSGPISARA